jgi:hypothetical protein
VQPVRDEQANAIVIAIVIAIATVIVRQVWMAASRSSGCRARLPVGAATQMIAGSNQIVSAPRRLGAALSSGQCLVLQKGVWVC